MLCSKIGCMEDARYVVGFTVYPGDGDVGADCWTEIKVCEMHRDDVTLETFLTDETWDVVSSIFPAMGKSAPVRDRTKIIFNELVDGMHWTGNPGMDA